jgi:hypothetical protein
MARDRLHLRRVCGRASDARERLERREEHRTQKRGAFRLERGLSCPMPGPAYRAFKRQDRDDPSPPPPRNARERATPPAARLGSCAHGLAQAASLRAPVSARGLLPAPVPTAAAVPSGRPVPRVRLRATLPARELAREPPARLPASLRLLCGARRSGLHRRRDPLPPALRGVYERRALHRNGDLMPAALPPSLHRRAPVSDDRVPARPADDAASVPDVQRQQPLLSLPRVARPGLARARAGQTIAG